MSKYLNHRWWKLNTLNAIEPVEWLGKGSVLETLQFESRQEKMDESEDELINEANGVINVASDKLQMHEIGMRPIHNKLRFVISKAPINYRLS